MNFLPVTITMGQVIKMKSKFRKINLLLVLLVLMVIVFNFFYFTFNRGEVLNDSCVSVFRIEDHTNELHSIETAKLVFNPDKSGYIALSGNVSEYGKVMTLSRDLNFKYEKENKNIYKMTNIETVKHSKDNVPDALFNSMFLSTQHEKARYMTVDKIMNSYVIGNLHSPVFICVVK